MQQSCSCWKLQVVSTDDEMAGMLIIYKFALDRENLKYFDLLYMIDYQKALAAD